MLDATPCNPRVVARLVALLRTPPWGKTDQPDFLNAPAEIRSQPCAAAAAGALPRTPSAALKGGAPRERWGPRIVESIFLAFRDCLIREPGWKVPIR